MHLDNCTENDLRKNVGQLRSQWKRWWRKKNNWSQDQATKRSSYKEHRVDALAPYAEEGRSNLRKATGSRKQALIRGYPNGETRQVNSLSLPDEHIVWTEETPGTETSKYREEKKAKAIF